MTNQEFRAIIRKLGKLMTEKGKRGIVVFDPSSYDDINDIPVFLYQGAPYIVKSVEINTKSDELIIYFSEGPFHSITFPIASLDIEGESDYDPENIEEIIKETYYGTSQSWEIGDFEDFIEAELKEFI